MRTITERMLLAVVMAATPAIAIHASQLGPATICAGAATLNNGSIVNIGQPFVGIASAPGATTLALGLISTLQSISGTPARPTFASSPTFQNGHLQLTLFSQPGYNYVLEASTNFTGWTPVATNAATGLTIILEDPSIGSFNYRFYRAQVQ